MKIVIPMLGFAKAGGYRVLSRLSDEWIGLGHEVIIIVNEALTSSPYFPTNAKIMYLSSTGDEVALNSNKILNAKQGVKGVLSNLLTLKRGLDKIATADVILANQSLTTYPTYFSSIAGKKYYYIQAYEPEYYLLTQRFSSRFLAYISKLSYSLPLFKVVNSEIYFNYKEIKSEICVYPGLDLNVFYPRERNDMNSDHLVLGCIGRNEVWKGTSFVIKAFKQIRLSNKKAKLLIAFGDKDFEDKENGIEIVTPNGDDNLAGFYNSLDILIAPGTLQLGAVHYPVIEAMACKIPVITTGYYPADESNSWLVKVKDSESIVNRVKEITSNKTTMHQKVNKAYQDVLQFEWSIVARKFIEVFENHAQL